MLLKQAFATDFELTKELVGVSLPGATQDVLGVLISGATSVGENCYCDVITLVSSLFIPSVWAQYQQLITTNFAKINAGM